jgi:hypothetical protein
MKILQLNFNIKNKKMLMKDYFNLRKSKLLLLMLLTMIVGASPAWAQQSLPYSYGFEDYDLTKDGWLKVITTSLTNNNNECAIVGTAKKTGSYGFRFSSYNTSGANAQYLISPELDASTEINLTFAYAGSSSSGNEVFKVGYSTTDTNIESFTFGDEISTSRSTTWKTYENIFPVGTKHIAIYYYSNYQYRLYVDDFTFTAPPTCIAPTGLIVSDIKSSSVKLAWTAAPETDTWNVQYKAASDADWTDVGGTISTNPYTLTGLTPETAYQARIRTYCSSEDQSDWTDAVSFTTPVKYPAPTTLTANAISSTSATLTWTANGEETVWEVAYSTSNTTPDVDGTYDEATSATFNITGLTANTTYYAWVRAKGDDGHSAWSSVYTFKTALVAPFTEDFTDKTSIPSGWAQYSGLMENVLNGTANLSSGSGWSFGTPNGVLTSNHAYSNVYGSSCYRWLVTPNVELGVNQQISFNLALTAYSGTAAAAGTTGTDDKFAVLVSTDNGATWTSLALWDNAGSANVYNNIATTGEEIAISLAAYNNQTVKIAFYVESTTSNADNNLHIDDVEISEASAFPKPTGLAISNLTATSATLTWEAGEATLWEVAINTTGSEPTEAGTVVNAATYDFSGLTAETTYYAFVRATDGNNYGKWSVACKFTPTAAVDLTIFDGTDTNSYLPVSGYSSSYTAYAQFIIPSTALTLVQNGKIKKLTFHSTEATKTLTNYNVYVKETDDAIFTSTDASDVNGMTTVYSGALSVAGNKMEVVFNEPFEYTNKNLQVAFVQSTKSGASSTWYGVTQSTNVGRKKYYTTAGYVQFLPKTTINYIAYVSETPTLRITDPNSQILTESPATYEFGMTETAKTANFTLQNAGLGSLTVKSIAATGGYLVKIGEGEATANISSTVIGTNEDSPVTLQVVQPEGISEGAITITTDVDGDDVDETFVINVSGMVRDANKIYENRFTALPTGWTSEGNWSYSAANGAYTQAWYIDQQTLARLKTPKLTVAEGEKFIIEAKGHSTSYTEYQHLVLQYSENGTEWTTAGEELVLDPSNWKTFTVTGVPAGEYYIGLLASQADIRMFYGGEKITGANFAISIADNAEQDFGRVKANAVAEKTYTVTNNGNADLTVTFTDATDFYVAKTVKFTKPNDWSSVNFYVWDSSNNAINGAWPGNTMTYSYTNEYSQDVYVAALPKGATGIIFSNNGNSQTSDISTTDFKHAIAYYLDNGTPIQWQNDDFTVAANGGSASFTVKMDTKTSGDKSGDVELAFTALNATSFTIPCTGYVLDPNYLIVDFNDPNAFPEGWQIASDWKVSVSGYAYQESTTTPSAFVTTPLTVAEDETLTFKVARNASGQGYKTSLKIRYSTDGGATWSNYTDYAPDGTSLSSKTLTGIPAGTVILEFLGSNVKIDDIEGFTKTTAPALALTESGAAVVNGSTKDLGNLKNEDGIATYTLKNIGNANLVATLSGTDVTVSPANVNLAAGESAEITVTMAYEEPFGVKNGSMTIDSEDWVGDVTVYFTATLIDPTDFVEDFTSGKPAGWYSEGWTYTDGVATVNSGSEQSMITEKINAVDEHNTLSFKAYSNGSVSDLRILNVYTSSDRKAWSDANVFNLTSSSDTYTLNLSNGEQYIKFGGRNATIEEIKGVKRLDAPEHDLYLASATLPTDEITPIDNYTATLKVASLRADEEVTAELYFGENKVATTTTTITNGSTVTITLEGKASAGTYEVYAKVSAGDINIETEKVNVTVEDKTELAITNFVPVTTAVTADDDNMFTAEFNVTVKNTGSVAIATEDININITDKDNVAYSNVTKTNETVFMIPGAYTADNAKFFIYRFSTDTDQEWGEFTKIADNLYSADLNGKTKFIIVRKASDATSGFDGAWNQSVDLEASAGICFTFEGWDNTDGSGHHNFTASESVNLPNNASLKLKVAVTDVAENSGAFEFKAQENVSETWWYNSYGYTQTVNVTAAPTIVLNETSTDAFATGSNRKVQLKRTFVAGWNTVCLPFAIDNIEEVFGAGAIVYAFTDYNDGVLNFSKVTTELEAAKPYVVYVENAITEAINLSGITIDGTEASATTINGAIFQGTYTPMAAGTMTGKYGVTTEAKIAKGTATASMKGFRAYFELPHGAAARIAFFDENGNSTNIGTIAAEKADGQIFNLQGQRVESMKKGNLYIIDGKKVTRK